MAVYLNNKLIDINNPIMFKPIVFRPDAELIQTYNRDYKLVADDEITIPSYSTSNQAVQATVNLSPTITLDYTNYNYYITEQFLAIPEYNVTTTGKGKVEYDFTASLMELVEMEPNTFKSLDKQKVYASRWAPIVQQNLYCSVYWSSATAIAPYNTSSYGIILVPNSPSISSGVMTVRTPTINMRGNTTYFTSTYFNAITDIRVQYLIKVFRAPKNNLNFNGWGDFNLGKDIINCVQNNNNYVLS